MRTTKELFGNVPRAVWKLQYKLAVKRIDLAKDMLANALNQPLAIRDHHEEAKYIKAIRFWENMRDEAYGELK